jgi:hypothetical protein
VVFAGNEHNANAMLSQNNNCLSDLKD